MSDILPSKPKATVLHAQLTCKNKCGYFGNPEWQGYCSKCHRELNQKTKSKGSLKHESSLNLGFSKFEEKKKQQSEKKSKTIKSLIKRGHSSKESETHLLSRDVFSTAEVMQFSKDLQLKETIVKDVLKQIQKQLDIMSKYYDKSIDEQSEAMQDFYNFMSNRCEVNPHYQDLNGEQVDLLMDKIEELLMIKMHRIVFQQISSEYEEKDLALQKRIRSLNWITPQRLGLEINESSPDVRDLVESAITDVIEMDSKIAPQEKISCIVKCSRNIFNIINFCQGVTASADEFLPAMVYVVLRANPPLLQSNVKYITSYSIPIRLRSGEGAYYFTNLCCAVAFIENLTSESLNLTNEEFQRYLSGEVPVGSSEESSTACEGFRLMAQNLDTLNEMYEKNTQVLNDMLALKNEMSKFEDIILKCKPSSPFVINQTPYVLPANTDLNLIPKILHDRVIMEDLPDNILIDIDSQSKESETEAKDSDIINNTGSHSFNDNSALSDYHNNMSLTESKVLCPVPPTISKFTIMQPLHVALPSQDNSRNCDFSDLLSQSVPVSNISQPMFNIKDLEYPTEIFPDANSEESPRSELFEGTRSNNVDYIDNVHNPAIGDLIDPLSPETGFMEENLNLPPPLVPVVVQNINVDATKKT